MAGSERQHPERIRALIEEVDRVFRETESVAHEVNHSMKRDPFWPERRKAVRVPRDATRGRGDDAA